MISTPANLLKQRVLRWQAQLGTGEIIEGHSMIGGGSLPEESLPTFMLALKVKAPNKFLSKLRALPTPIIARIENDMVVLDPRTVLPDQDETLSAELKTAIP
jgi:L-seryl-tRNA(Ser) seleniumtransferase